MSGKPESPLMTQVITIDGQYVTLDPNNSAILSVDEVRAVLDYIQQCKSAATEAQNKLVKQLVKQSKRLSFLETAFPVSERKLNEYIEKTRDAEAEVRRLLAENLALQERLKELNVAAKSWCSHCFSLTAENSHLRADHPEIAAEYDRWQESYERGYADGQHFSRGEIARLNAENADLRTVMEKQQRPTLTTSKGDPVYISIGSDGAERINPHA